MLRKRRETFRVQSSNKLSKESNIQKEREEKKKKGVQSYLKILQGCILKNERCIP